MSADLLLMTYSAPVPSSTIAMATGPDQPHFGHVMIPVAIVRRSISAKLMICPH
jgi:hypothetical protein